ncbi:MAG: matrixin family metalloprotease [Planctomycetes bacterium]|nr:matrixin family metalloprotease [Planctomycetota bacterium]
MLAGILWLLAQDGQDLFREADRAYDAVLAIVREMRGLAEKGGTQAEIDERIARIDRLADETKSGGRRVLHGTRPTPLPAAKGVRSAGTPWRRIVDAVGKLESGDQTVAFTFSFIIAGTDMEKGPSLAIRDHRDGRPAAEEFRQEIREALAVWEDLFERTFCTANGYGGNLEIRFVDLGDEKGNSHGSNRSTPQYGIPGPENIGDLRYGVEKLGTTASPHSPMGRTADGMGDDGGDVHFDSGQDWRRDRDERGGLTSVKIVAAHEMGHGFALAHDEKTAPMTLMNPRMIVTNSFHRKFPEGLYFDGSSERAAIVTHYGAKARLVEPRPFRFGDVAIDLPAVSAAALGISAIKVRTREEAAEAVKRIGAAEAKLAEHKAGLKALRKD